MRSYNKYALSFLVFVTIYSMIADYSVYYIKGSYTLSCLLGTLLILSAPKIIDKTKIVNSVLFFFSWLLLFLVSLILNNCPLPFNAYCYILISSIFILLKDESKYFVYNHFVKIYVVILSVSLVEYLFYFAGITIFSFGTVYRGGDIFGFGDFEQLLFNVVKKRDFIRFQSLFEEPGMVGTINGLLLCVLPSQVYKKQRWILLVSGLFTFSMAFYILYLISLLKSKLSIGKIITVLALLLTFIYLFRDTVEELVILRVAEEKLDNRTHDNFSYLYEKAERKGELILGKGYAQYRDNVEEEANAGAKVFIYQYGYVGLLLIFILYVGLVKKSTKIGRNEIIFLIAFWASFYQRHYIEQLYYVVIVFSFFIDYRYIMEKRTFKNDSYIPISDNSILHVSECTSKND